MRSRWVTANPALKSASAATLEHRAAGQRGLMAAGAALAVHPARTPKPRAWPTVALRAAKPLRPARPVQRAVALRLRAVPLDELRHRQPHLELHLVHGHAGSPPRNVAPRLRRARLTSRDGRLSVVANQVLIRVILAIENKYFNTICALRCLSDSIRNASRAADLPAVVSALFRTTWSIEPPNSLSE